MGIQEKLALVDRIQKEQKEWAFQNFGKQAPGQMVLGMIEELGELAEGVEERDLAKIEDAIGDVGIYMSNYCNIKELSLSQLWYRRHRGISTMLPSLMRRMAHHQLKGEQNIRGGTELHEAAMSDLLCEVIDMLHVMSAFYCRVSFTDVLKKTWIRVSKRDWVENPNDADVVAEAQDG